MANENVSTPAPTRSDDQILPFPAWFWDTIIFEAKTGAYRFQLDKYWFRLDVNLLREALEITPVDQAQQFVSTLWGDAIMHFVNQLGYPGEIHFVSSMAAHISSPSNAVGIITRTNIDYAEPIWEEFVQTIQTFLVDKANLGSLTKKGKKTKPHVVPYSRFTKLFIYYLEDITIFTKGEINEVFGMKIPEELIMNNIKNAPYYNAYLEMVAKHERGIAAAKEGGKKKITPKAAKHVKPAPAKQAKPETAKQPKPKLVKEKPTKPTPIQKVRKEATHPLPMVEGKGKAIAMEEQAAQSLLALHTPKRRSTTNQFIFQRQTPATEKESIGASTQPQDDTSANIVRETPSHADTKTGTDTEKVINEGDTEILNIGEEQEEDVDNQVYLEEQTAKLNEGQAGSDPGKTLESRPPPDDDKMDEDHAGSDPRKSHFFNDKSTEDEPGKQNVNTEVVSMVTIPILKAFTSVPPLSTPIIGLSPPKPAASPLLESFSAVINETTTITLPLLPPPQQKRTIDSELTARITALEKKFSDFEQKSQTLNNETQNVGSRVFNLELQDLPHKINQTVNKVIKEAVHIALQAPLRDRFMRAARIEDVPILDYVNIPDSEDTNTTHLPKIKTRPDWLNPLPEEDRPKTLKLYWIIPSTNLPEAENNWADALATSYKDPEENKLLSKTGDMGSADYKEYKILKADFKNLHLNDFEDLYLLHLQGKFNHLPGSDKAASDILFKEDYTIISKSRALIYRDRNDQKKMLRENESEDDKRRSEEFMEVIKRRLKIQRIFRSLESGVGGRLRDVDYRTLNRTE
uniref:Monodehydroascorbate reductase n=1 Tax=Tanacetum cinerariifolium TaxID=118510 RepID=A0A699HL42_TANCI|nr:hypothetical protein [Tanacetum cinerariifolium]